MDKILSDLGLTSNEKKIYKMLLYNGSSPAGLISLKTGIHRRNVYDSIKRLQHKGLIGYIKENNRKVYSITNPERILKKYEQRVKDVNEILPELLSLYDKADERKETLFYRGKAGIRMIFYDQINEGKEVLVSATNAPVDDVLKYFMPKYQLLRKEKKIFTRMIFDKSFDNKKNRAKLDSLPLCKYGFVSEFNKSPMSQYIYGDNVAIIVWSNEPIAILIRQKEISTGFKQNFEIMWNLATPK